MDWEGHYREKDIPWDLAGPAPPLRELLDGGFSAWEQGPLLVPGCGRGHDAALLHQHGWEVIGLDLSGTALAWARDFYGGSADLQWLERDFFEPPPDEWIVGGIFEHTCFCAIPPQRRAEYVASAARWLPVGGILVGLFFLDPPKNLGDEGPPFGVTMADISELFTQSFSLEWAMRPTIADPSRFGCELLVKMVRSH